MIAQHYSNKYVQDTGSSPILTQCKTISYTVSKYFHQLQVTMIAWYKTINNDVASIVGYVRVCEKFSKCD